MEELKCADCGIFYEVEEELYDRYMYEGGDYQCEKCFYESRNKLFDNINNKTLTPRL